MTAGPKPLRVATLAQLAKRLPLRVEARRVFPPIDVSIPPVSYGQVAPPERAVRQCPPDNWFERAYTLHDGFLHTLRNAVVHTELGVISVDRYVVAESLPGAPSALAGLDWIDPEHLGPPDPGPARHLSRAIHALSGSGADRDYARWWTNIVPVATFAIFRDLVAAHTLIVPPFTAEYQRQTIELLPEIAGRYVDIGARGRIACDELLFVPRLTASDYTPHPGRMRFMAEIKRRVSAARGGARKLYLRDRDAAAPPLANADAIEGIAAELGYTAVTTAGLSVPDQIRLFAEAGRVIAPHGAGLANILFCPPWGRLLELHRDRGIDWSARRLAAIVPMTYGCVVGRQEPCRPDQTEAESRTNPWTIDAGAFRDAVVAMG